MNVFYFQELEFDVCVMVVIFVVFISRFIGYGINLKQY